MGLRRSSMSESRNRLARKARQRLDHSALDGSVGLEPLEARALLANTGFPALSALTDVNNTVVRLQIAYGSTRGNIDIELFDRQAPITVTNFLGYVTRGDYDKSFFHRLSAGFVIQGGLARLQAPTNTGTFTSAIDNIPTKATIQNEFSSTRSNVARTLAMAKLGGNPNSASSQWFFNLANNAGNLDTQNGGFTVFARVADDESWAVVQAMSNTSNVTISTTQASPFDELPVSGTFTGTNPAESSLVTIVDAEIIKPKDVPAFYTHRYTYPEGFTGSSINEYLPMGNTTGSTIHYQVVIRNEVRDANPGGNRDFWYRDLVIDTNSIAPNKRAGFQTSYANQPSRNLVPKAGKAYTYEVYSTGPLAITLSHYDSGSSTIESFSGGLAFPTTGTGTALPPTGSSNRWTISDIRKGSGNTDYLLWANLSSSAAAVSVTFYPEGGAAPIVLNFPTEALRRGGLNINQLTQLPDGNLSAQLNSDQPLVAALTHYLVSGTVSRGATSLGVPGNGSNIGLLPFASVSSDGAVTDQLAFINTSSSAAIISLVFQFSDGTPDLAFTPSQNIIGANQRVTYNLNQIPSLTGKRFSVRYTSAGTAVYGSTLHSEFSDLAANPFAVTAATTHEFGEGFLDVARNPATLSERFGVYNPNETTITGTDIPANITFTLNYTDGSTITKSYSIPAGKRLEINPVSFPEMVAKNNAGLFFFSVNISSDVPVVAMGNHYDTGLGDSFLGTQRGTILRLSSTGGSST